MPARTDTTARYRPAEVPGGRRNGKCYVSESSLMGKQAKLKGGRGAPRDLQFLPDVLCRQPAPALALPQPAPSLIVARRIIPGYEERKSTTGATVDSLGRA